MSLNKVEYLKEPNTPYGVLVFIILAFMFSAPSLTWTPPLRVSWHAALEYEHVGKPTGSLYTMDIMHICVTYACRKKAFLQAYMNL